MARSPKIRVVLVIAGNDPSGGAGLCADIQTVSALGCHPAPVITAVTVQDTHNAYQVESIAAELVISQARAVLNDLPVAAIKLGLLGSVATGKAVTTLLADFSHIPVIIDPVLVATGGASLAESGLVDVYLEHLLQHATVVTPNAFEIAQLGLPATDHAAQATRLLATGCSFVLSKGGDANTQEINNQLFGPAGQVHEYSWPRTPGVFHGSGCTLASALAAYIARGETVITAVELAQEYTAQAIKHGWQPGKGQIIPARMKTP